MLRIDKENQIITLLANEKQRLEEKNKQLQRALELKQKELDTCLERKDNDIITLLANEKQCLEEQNKQLQRALELKELDTSLERIDKKNQIISVLVNQEQSLKEKIEQLQCALELKQNQLDSSLIIQEFKKHNVFKTSNKPSSLFLEQERILETQQLEIAKYLKKINEQERKIEELKSNFSSQKEKVKTFLDERRSKFINLLNQFAFHMETHIEMEKELLQYSCSRTKEGIDDEPNMYQEVQKLPESRMLIATRCQHDLKEFKQSFDITLAELQYKDINLNGSSSITKDSPKFLGFKKSLLDVSFIPKSRNCSSREFELLHNEMKVETAKQDRTVPEPMLSVIRDFTEW